MRKALITLILITLNLSAFGADEIILSSKIKTKYHDKISKDLALLDTFPFRNEADLKTLRVMGIEQLTAETATAWLNQRVKYIVEEKAFTKTNIKLNKSLYVEKSHVQYPNPALKPFSITSTTESSQDNSSFITMTNVGAEFYMNGKNEHKLYGVKVIQDFPERQIRVRINSPRAGILQIGAGLFTPELAINRIDEFAFANSIMRLAFLFHEARHSDGNGISLGFAHSICPKGHDYEGEPACDESLNGAYSVGAAMAREMMLACLGNCSERDKEMLKIFIMDNYNRIQTKTHLNTNAKYWDPTPEKFQSPTKELK